MNLSIASLLSMLTLPFDAVLAEQAVGGGCVSGSVDPGDADIGVTVTLDTAALALVSGRVNTALGPLSYGVSFSFTAA